MGCCCHSAFNEAYKTEQFQDWMKQFNAMQLSKREIRTLWYIFRKVDVDGSGNIGLAELLAHIDLERTKFTERIFSIFDEDGSGEIDFREFVLSLWNYCTLTKATLDMFAFDLYDKDSSGELSASEVARMLQDIYGKKEVKNNFLAKSVANDLKEIEKSGQLLDIAQYRQFVKTHQALLFPAFQMQLALQRKILGVRFWEKNANKRLKFSNGKYISVGNFILFNVDSKKKTLLSADAPEAKAMQGVNHMDQDVGKLMEVAGTKAARRKTVMMNERIEGPSASAKGSGMELFSIKSKAAYDTSVPMNESSKKAWLAAIFTAPAIAFASTSSSKQSATGGSMKSAKNAKQVQVSQKSSQKSSGTAAIDAAASGSGKPRRNSKDSDEADPRRSSKEKNGVGIAEVDRSGADSRKRGTKEDVAAVPSGRLKNPALTKDAIGRIEQVSPIDAWANQPMASEKKTKPSAAVAVGIAAVTASSKYRIAAGDAGAGASGGGGAEGIALSGKSTKNKYSSQVEAFDASGFSDEEKDHSSSKPLQRRGSLSKYPNTQGHNNTWAETTTGTVQEPSPGASASVKISAKRRGSFS